MDLLRKHDARNARAQWNLKKVSFLEINLIELGQSYLRCTTSEIVFFPDYLAHLSGHEMKIG